MPEEKVYEEGLAHGEETAGEEIREEKIIAEKTNSEKTIDGETDTEETAIEKTTAGEADTEEAIAEEADTEETNTEKINTGEAEESVYGEAVQNEEHTEDTAQGEIKGAAQEEKQNRKLEQAGEDAFTEERAGETIRRENEAVWEEMAAEETAWEQEEYAVSGAEAEGETAEEIIYTEGEGMEEMGEQEYRTAEDNKFEPEFVEEEPKRRGFFRRNKEEAHFLRDKWILSRIRDEDLMDYLVLEQKRHEELQKARDIREKRIISAFKLTVSLAAGVAVVYLLKDNPTIFVNILYIGGILGGFWFWKNSKEK